jgi:hypothetical protein
MRYWILLLLPLMFVACKDKIADPNNGGNNNNPDAPTESILPLRTGNWWEYHVTSDTATSSYTLRRSVGALKVIGNAGYYPIIDSVLNGSPADTIYYLRGVRDYGIISLAYPAEGAVPDTLFLYPHVHSGTHYTFLSDSVVVLSEPPGAHNVQIGDSLYTVMAYQRFFDGDPHHSIRYDLNADSTGILRETLVGSGGYIAVQTDRHLVQ